VGREDPTGRIQSEASFKGSSTTIAPFQYLDGESRTIKREGGGSPREIRGHKARPQQNEIKKKED